MLSAPGPGWAWAAAATGRRWAGAWGRPGMVPELPKRGRQVGTAEIGRRRGGNCGSELSGVHLLVGVSGQETYSPGQRGRLGRALVAVK